MTQSSHAVSAPEDGFTVDELEREHANELPGRDLLLGLSLLGIPLLQVSGLDIKIS